jgi:ribonuclease T2
MRRGDVTVWSLSAALAVVAAAGVTFSLLVLDRRPVPAPAAPGASDSSLLVVTWAPSLCKVERSNPGCRSGHVQRVGRAFLLHGLWPQPSTEQYCEVPGGQRGRQRQSVVLPADLQARLQAAMSDAAVMTRHEWNAHGTCSGLTPPEYFDIAATLADQAGATLEPVFGESVGRPVTAAAVRGAFDAAVGPGAGDRVSMTCRRVGQDQLAYEVRLSLPPVAELRGDTLRQALAAGPEVASGCGQGTVP